MASSNRTSHAALFFIVLLGALGAKYAVDDYPIFVRAALSLSLMSPFRYVHNTFGFRSPFSTSSISHKLLTALHGGDENAGEIKNETPQETLYLPSLLKTKVIPWTKESPTAASENSNVISKTKACELKVESGDVVGIIGRRRHVSYVRWFVYYDSFFSLVLEILQS
jgi:hypothetical protein